MSHHQFCHIQFCRSRGKVFSATWIWVLRQEFGEHSDCRLLVPQARKNKWPLLKNGGRVAFLWQHFFVAFATTADSAHFCIPSRYSCVATFCFYTLEKIATAKNVQMRFQSKIGFSIFPSSLLENLESSTTASSYSLPASQKRHQQHRRRNSGSFVNTRKCKWKVSS